MPTRKIAAASAIVVAAGVAIVTLHATSTLGQANAAVDEALVESGKRVWQGRAGCPNCHGWAGDGKPALNYPAGANLRETTLTAEQIAEVVQCGRPGTEMPFHDREAYADGRCYGLGAGQAGAMVPPAGASLQSNQIQAVAAYVAARQKGRSRVSKADCLAYFPDGAGCGAYD